MRVLLDENLPADLTQQLSAHDVQTVAGMKWAGVKNGELLRRATGRFDAFITMDGNLEFQQAIDRQAFGVVIVSAPSNRMEHLKPLVSVILAALVGIRAGELRKVGNV
jgi:hypothetical protein